jgi:hypothetical protein
MAIALTTIFFVSVVGYYAYHKGKADGIKQVATPIPETDLAARRAYLNAMDDAHASYMRSIANTQVTMNPAAGARNSSV